MKKQNKKPRYKVKVDREKPDTKDYIDRRDAPGVMFRPSTLDEKTRSIEVVAATEIPVLIYDPYRYETIEEILLMSGAQYPEKVPLTVEHQRDASAVIGSFRDIKIDNNEMVGRVYFSTAKDADPYYIKTKEQHLDRFSVTYEAGSRESIYVAEGETSVIQGLAYQGPVLVTIKWKLRSLGLVIYGADENAKSRNEINDNNHKGASEMDKQLRAFLERSGLKADATEAEAQAFLASLDANRSKPTEPVKVAPVEPVKVVDEEAVRRAVDEEIARSTEIRSMCERFEYPKDETEKLVKDRVSVEAARKAVLDHIEKTRKDPNPGTPVPLNIQLDEKDKFRAAVDDALVIRAASSVKVEKPAQGAREVAGFSLVEIARHCLRVENKDYHGRPLDVVGRAMTTSDFPYILAATANKFLLEGWNTEPETWKEWCATGSTPDFKTQTGVNISEFSDLEEVPEDTEYKYGSRTETREQWSIVTYGKLASISRQAVVNDDLDAITSNFMGMGEAAARKVGDLPYAVLTANAAMGDGIALFDAGTHGNYASTGTALGTTTLTAMILAMGTQTDLAGLRKLNIRPEFILLPKALEGSSEVFFQSTAFSETGTAATDSTFASTRANIYSGTYFKRIYEARLDDNSVTGWYAAARKGKTVKVFFLNGVQSPYMEMEQGFTVDGTTYKVRIDAGAKAMDWRGLFWDDGV